MKCSFTNPDHLVRINSGITRRVVLLWTVTHLRVVWPSPLKFIKTFYLVSRPPVLPSLSPFAVFRLAKLGLHFKVKINRNIYLNYRHFPSAQFVIAGVKQKLFNALPLLSNLELIIKCILTQGEGWGRLIVFYNWLRTGYPRCRRYL